MRPIKELWDRLLQENNQAKTMEDTRSDTYGIDMRFSNLGVIELACQQQFLLDLLGQVEDQGECLEGILNMIGIIQADLSEAYAFPDEIVDPFNNGYSPVDGEMINYKRAFRTLLKLLPLEDLPKYLNKDPDLDILIKRFFDKGDVL